MLARSTTAGRADGRERVAGQFDVEAALRRHFGDVNSRLQHQIDPLLEKAASWRRHSARKAARKVSEYAEGIGGGG